MDRWMDGWVINDDLNPDFTLIDLVSRKSDGIYPCIYDIEKRPWSHSIRDNIDASI